MSHSSLPHDVNKHQCYLYYIDGKLNKFACLYEVINLLCVNSNRCKRHNLGLILAYDSDIMNEIHLSNRMKNKIEKLLQYMRILT